jgi:transmembrane sensor
LILKSEREQIEELAAQWVLRADRGLSAEESAALAAWLDASLANRLAYLRLKAGWQRTERLAALRDGDAFADKPRPHVRWQAMAVAATVLVLLGIGTAVFLHFHVAAPAVYTTQLGERPILRLSDGTRIQLNTDTQVQTDVTRVARTVTLERGEAFFEVVHDDKRPFVVIAGNRRITDLGTKFSVRRDGDNVKVIVTEGQVRVDILNAPVPSLPVFANEGNIVVAKADETLVVPKSLRDMAGDLSWRDGMLVFDQETLSSVAEQFNRYNRRRIVVQGRARDIRIGGSFRADNIDSFALLIRGSLGLKVTQEEDQITISE